MNDVKYRILDAIKEVAPIFRRVPPEEYRIRCPLCGDSRTNPNDSHCYIKCSDNPTEPLLYYCQKCNKGGRVNAWFLKQLNVDSTVLDLINDQRYNKLTTVKEFNADMILGDVIENSPQTRYITDRLGDGFTKEDYDRFKIVWNWDNIVPFISDNRTLNTLPSNTNSISFLSDDKAMIITRTFETGDDSQWRKINIGRTNQKAFYTIKSQFNLFTSDEVTVSIAEGIFDILSAYRNFKDSDNSVFIATLGSDYISAVDYIIAKGVIGSNVVLRIYIDNGIDEKNLIRGLKSYKWIFKSIKIYKNIKSKDIGVRDEYIKLVERRV